MKDFIPLGIKDKILFQKYLQKIDAESYEYSFHSLYLWRSFSNVKYSILDDILVVEKREQDKGTYFMEPIGYKDEDLPALIYKLRHIQKLRKNDLLFGDIEQKFIDKIKNIDCDHVKIIEDINHFEYVYSTKELIDLKGHKYSNKKNHCSNFAKLYDYELTEINNEKIIDDCINLLDKWQQRKGLYSKEIIEEIAVIKDILFKLELLNLKSMAVYVKDNMAGFSIGGYIKNNAGVIHIEKGDTNFKGIYQFLNREFLKKDFSTTDIINRQEDCGIEGLKIAKTSYHPIKMVKKFLISTV